MPTTPAPTLFSYRALDAAGKLHTARSYATSYLVLEQKLAQQGMEIVYWRQVSDLEQRWSRWRQGHTFSKAALLRGLFHLQQLLLAGVPLLAVLHELQHSAENRRLGELYGEMRLAITHGASLHEAMQAQGAGAGQVFSPVVCALVGAGEAAGLLPEMLERAANLLRWELALKQRMHKLLLYPAVTAVVSGSAALFLLLYVVPQLQPFLSNLAYTPPWHTTALFGLAHFLRDYGLLAMLSLVILCFGLWLGLRHPACCLWRDQQILRLPWWGSLLQRQLLARFATVFASLYAAGLPVLAALRICHDVVGNQYCAAQLAEIEQRTRAGATLLEAFRHHTFFPPLVLQMLAVGENTGRLELSLQQVGQFYDQELEHAVAQSEALIEPALLLVLGGLVLWIALAVLGPIYDVLMKVGG